MALTILTWKAGFKGKGIKRPLQSKLYGGNVGHAAMELTWPVNAEGDGLAKKYEGVDGVQISKRTEYVPKLRDDGNYERVSQIVYFAYFSWWPSSDGSAHHISSILEDQQSEWENEPSGAIKSEYREMFLENGEMPMANRTLVGGILTREKEIEKVLKTEHPTLQSTINDDPAYMELKNKEQEIMVEINTMYALGNQDRQERRIATEENREPRPEMIMTEEQKQRIETISNEMRIITQQIVTCKNDFNQRHQVTGNSPDAEVILPTDCDGNAPEFALNTEQLLDKMVDLSRSEERYNMRKFNCSTSVVHVLKAGVTDTLKAEMLENDFNFNNALKAKIKTPTVLNRVSQQLQTQLVELNSGVGAVAKTTLDTTVDYRKRLQEMTESSGSDLESEESDTFKP